jgi:hypothetical protein
VAGCCECGDEPSVLAPRILLLLLTLIGFLPGGSVLPVAVFDHHGNIS